MVVVILLSLIVAILTYMLSQNPRLGSIRSSCLVTFVFLIGLDITASFMIVDTDLAAVVFGASFVGMSQSKVLSYKLLILSTFIFALIFVNFIDLLAGMGGALGFSAFLSVSLVYGFNQLVLKARAQINL